MGTLIKTNFSDIKAHEVTVLKVLFLQLLYSFFMKIIFFKILPIQTEILFVFTFFIIFDLLRVTVFAFLLFPLIEEKILKF